MGRTVRSPRAIRQARVGRRVLSIGGGPLVSLAVATNVLSALTGSASCGLTNAAALRGPRATGGTRLWFKN
jgi:H+/gluconate symporter-like permease